VYCARPRYALAAMCPVFWTPRLRFGTEGSYRAVAIAGKLIEPPDCCCCGR
jgi:hypothetical protein